MQQIVHKETATKPAGFPLKSLAKAAFLQIDNTIAILLSLDYSSLKLIERSLSMVRLIIKPARHRRVVEAISAISLHPILIKHPKLAVKYLKSNYLSPELTTSQRADAFCHHYHFLSNNFDRMTIRRVLFDAMPIWELRDTAYTHSMSILLSESFVQKLPKGLYRINCEGELSIHYRLNGVLIYIMSFTFVGGSIFGQEDQTILFVTRLQGVSDNFAMIQNATKSSNDISPPFALMAALEGLAKALRINKAIVTSYRKVGALRQGEQRNSSMYNSFFRTLGATEIAGIDSIAVCPHADYFQLSLPIFEKPITDIKRSHRSRTKAKRKIRKQISGTVSAAIVSHTGIDPPS